MTVIDAQIHLWKEDGSARPWPPGGRERSRQHGIGPLIPEQVLALMDEAGVDRAVLVPPTFSGGHNDVCLNAARTYPDRFAVVGHVAADDPEIAEVLTGWRRQAGMLGIRLTLSRGAAQGWIASGVLDEFWQVAESEQIPLYVLPPGLFDQLGKVATTHPELRIIVDHLGIRTGEQDIAILPSIEALLPLSDYPNIAVKASCLPAYVSEEYPYRGMQQIVKRVVAAFGAERVFWGSDMTRLRCPYRDVVRLFTEEMDFLTAHELEWVMGRGLAHWLSWPI